VLNLGHTYGHALEVEMGYEDLRHGEAVAFGLVVATGVAERLGACAPEDARRIRELIERYGILPAIAPDSLRGAVKHTGSIRLVRGGRLNFVLPTSTQSCEIRPELPPDLLEAVVDELAATRE
jgi:3-dehydroquinate synthase